MQSEAPRLIYLDVPKHCEGAVSLLDLKVRPFTKALKRVMKKLDKGETSVEKSIPRVNHAGLVEPSGYTLVADQTKVGTGLIFARLPGASGDSELLQLSFTRFSIKKDGVDDEVGSSTTGSISAVPNQIPQKSDVTMEKRLQQFSKKLDDLSSSIAVLSGSIHTPRCPSTPVQQTPIPVNGRSVKRRLPAVVAPDHDFMNRVDGTIDRVLRRINRGKDVQTITEMITVHNVQQYEALSSTRDELPNEASETKAAHVHTPTHQEDNLGLPPNSYQPVSKKRRLNKTFPFLPISTNVDMDHCL